jgi:hypothetical protein
MSKSRSEVCSGSLTLDLVVMKMCAKTEWVYKCIRTEKILSCKGKRERETRLQVKRQESSTQLELYLKKRGRRRER